MGSRKIRCAIAGVAWLEALTSTFVADNEHWFEQKRAGGRWGGAQYVALLDPSTAEMLRHALEGVARVTFNNPARKSLERSILRIEADLKVVGDD